jgi:CRP-like cAMP-binding protein
MADAQGSCRNILLRSLTSQDFALLAPLLTRITIKVDEVLAAPGEPIEAVFFPETGIVTYSEYHERGSRIGVGHTGYEGFAGWPVLLGSNSSPHEARMTAIGGIAFRISAADILAACRASPGLHDLLLRFVRVFTVQLSCTVVSSLTQSVENRLCRWTLMGHDRVEGDDIEVTHNEIAVMLAIRRSSVTDALHVLEGEGLIRCHRGMVTVRDRAGLRRRAGDTYGTAEAEYSRLIAPFPERA